jgi:hypothetical protein
LRLIDEDAVHLALLLLVADPGEEICRIIVELGLGRDAEARGDETDAVLGVEG